MDTEKINLKEIVTKESVICVFCSNGHGRSKFIARILNDLGYEKSRAISVRKVDQFDKDTLDDIAKSPVIICANTDVEGQLRFFGGELIKGKIIINLKMSEPDHIIASGHMSKNKTLELKQKISDQLKSLGF